MRTADNAEPAVPSGSLGAWRVVALAAWLGLAAGSAELLVLAVVKYGFGQWLRLGPDVPWLTPLADLLLLLPLGLAAALLTRLAPRLAPIRGVLFVLAVPALFTVLLAQPWISDKASLVLALGFAVQVARVGATRRSGLTRLVSRTLPVMAAGLLVLWLGVPAAHRFAEHRRLATLPAARSGAPNVLLVFLDTVRAISLSTYGYGRETSPELTALAREGVRFNWAIAPSSWTLPSHASVMTGRWAHELSSDWLTALDDRYPTLAEVLDRNGYATAGFVANYSYTTPEFGLARGFTHYDTYPPRFWEGVVSSSLGRRLMNSRLVRQLLKYYDIPNRKYSARVSEEFLRWLPHRGERPFFAFLNFFDPHEPYLPPAPFDRQFGSGHPAPSPYAYYTHRHVDLRREFRRHMSAAELRAQHDAYDGDIAYLDHTLGRLLAALRGRGLLDSTVVVVLGDHGEFLGERNEFLHGFNLFTPVTRVPLVIRYPGRVPAGVVVGDPVSLRDVAVTLLDLVGAPAPPLPGASLAGRWGQASPTASAPSSPVLSSFRPDSGGAMSFGIMAGRFHLIRNGNGTEELYDATADTFEVDDLARSESGRIAGAEMRRVLDSILAANPPVVRARKPGH